MTEQSTFWTTDTVGDDDALSREIWWKVLKSMMGSFEQTHKSGVAWGSGDGVNSPLLVVETSPASAAVKVNIGRAFVDGAWYETDAAETLSIAANNDGSGFARIDTIVLRKSYAVQTVRLAVLQGTPAASPAAPTLTQNSSTWEYPLANVAVANLFTTIVNANITDRRTAAINRKVQEGGTGLSAVALGQLMAGTAAETMGLVAAAIDYGKLVGDTAQATDMKWVSQRLHHLRANNTTSFSTSPVLVPFSSANWVNPNSYITYLTANQFRLEAGAYKIQGHMLVITSGAGAQRANFFLADAAAPTTPLAVSVSTNIPNSGTAEIIMLPHEFTSDGSQLFEVYAEREVAGGTCNLQTGAGLALTASSWGQELVIERLK
jgi:hypothetical protein